MRAHRRTWFSAPLVAVTACSSSGTKPDPLGTYDQIHVQGTACVIYEHVSCPKNATCNPPPPRAVECPAEMGGTQDARISSGPPGGDCRLIVAPCKALSCGVVIKCPSASWEHPVSPLAWTISPSEDGRCVATARPRTNFDGGAPPIPIDCPTGVLAAGVIERANPSAPCVVCGTSPCPPDARAILCPDVKAP